MSSDWDLREYPIVRARCQIANVDNREYFSARCVTRMESMLEALQRRYPSLEASRSDIQVLADRTCIDTFIPGREAADCEFFSIHGLVPIHFR